MDYSDKIVLTNVIGHVQAVIVSMAIVIRDVSKDGRDTIAMIEMPYQVFMSLIYPFNTMRIISIIYICGFSTKTLTNVKSTVWMIYLYTVLVYLRLIKS